MGNPFFWMPWFHKDFLAATQGWTLLERGAYFMLLGAQWDIGPLPIDRRRLASIIGAQLDELESVWSIVSTKFEVTDTGLVNRRLEQHRADQLSKSDKARQAARVRWNRGNECAADANASADVHAPVSAGGPAKHGSGHMLHGCHSESDSESNTDLNTEKIKKASVSVTPGQALAVPRVSRGTSDPEWFLDFKLAYPNRAGDQGWRKALKAANARIAEGHGLEELLEGARRYGAFCDATEKTGTEFVKQAATFLGPDKPFLLPWDLPLTKADVRQAQNISAAMEFMRNTDGATT